MALLKNYNDGKYEITIYTAGGSVRDRLTGEILADFTNYWTEDGSIHEETASQLNLIFEELGLIIDYKNFKPQSRKII